MSIIMGYLFRAGLWFLLAFLLAALASRVRAKGQQQPFSWREKFPNCLLIGYLAALFSQTIFPEVAFGVLANTGEPFFDVSNTTGEPFFDVYWGITDKVNLIPFRTIAQMAAGNLPVDAENIFSYAVINLVGSMALFFPLGLLLPWAWPKARRLSALLGRAVLLSVGIEFVQIFIDRSVDIDDVILNLLGAGLGWLTFTILSRVWAHVQPAKRGQRAL